MQAIRAKSKSSLFLIELLIIIAFFSVASVVCVRLFARAHMISTESRDLNRAMTVAQSAAECFKAAGGDMEYTAELFGGACRDELVVQHYDREWTPVPERPEGGYTLTLDPLDETGGLAAADIVVGNAGGAIFELQVLKHKGAAS